MPEAVLARSLERNPALVVASTYEREIGASLERVWENVYDWEHLPWLHSEAFREIDRLDDGDWGWHARVALSGGARAEIELVTDREGLRYVARTLEGAGAPTEIWTSLRPVSDSCTAIRVEFCMTEMPEEALRQVGEGYVSLYTLLWTQDEQMMQGREAALAEKLARMARAQSAPEEVVELGSVEALRASLPRVFEWSGRSYRLVEVDGALVAHATLCPHLLGPLGAAPVEEGCVVCPWHGYRFDVRTGRSADERGLRLAPAPRIEVDAESGLVRAVRNPDRVPTTRREEEDHESS